VDQLTHEKVLYLNKKYNAHFSNDFNFKGNNIEIAFKDFIPNSIDTVLPSENGKTIIEIVTVGKGGRLSRYIESGQTKFFGKFPVAFNDNSRTEAIKINPDTADAYDGRGTTKWYLRLDFCSDYKRACNLGLCINYKNLCK
jgi:hypothetical protein